jgi:hypothetical protein
MLEVLELHFDYYSNSSSSSTLGTVFLTRIFGPELFVRLSVSMCHLSNLGDKVFNMLPSYIKIEYDNPKKFKLVLQKIL